MRDPPYRMRKERVQTTRIDAQSFVRPWQPSMPAAAEDSSWVVIVIGIVLDGESEPRRSPFLPLKIFALLGPITDISDRLAKKAPTFCQTQTAPQIQR